MVRTYLTRGLVAGLLASLCAFAVAKTMGEPQVAKAEKFEYAQAQLRGEPPEKPLVSRAVQDTVGLGAGLVAAAVALGGLFALVFAFAYGRILRWRARASAAAIAAGAFVSVFLVPSLKYPSNPPAVGNPDTIGRRTALYFILVLVSVLALVLAVSVARRLRAGHGSWNAALLGAGTFIAVVGIAYLVMPGVNEVPASFPIIVLWRFRLASVAIQLTLWATVGLAFGAFTERHEARLRQGHLAASAAG